MSELTSSGAVAAGTKGLWAAVGVLGVAVVGLGGALYATQRPQALPELAVVGAPAQVPAAVAPAPEQPARAEPAPVAKPRPRVAPVRQAAVETPPGAPVAAPLPEARPVCADCATVQAVTPFEREVPSTGTGALAGGVLGAIVGHQVGQGSGRKLATVIGAIGGGMAGHQVEKKMQKVLAYRVELRMDDGSARTLEVDSPVTVGERVRFDGNTLQPLSAER